MSISLLPPSVLWTVLRGSLLLLLGTGCVISDDADCRTDDDCPAGARCLHSGGIFARDGVCLIASSADVGIIDSEKPDAEIPDTAIPDTAIPDTAIPDVQLPQDAERDDVAAPELCAAQPDGTACPVEAPCSTGSCQDGECIASSICQGTTQSCGCEACQSCDGAGWFNRGDSVPCCSDDGESCLCTEQEFRVPLCTDEGLCDYEVTETRTTINQCTSCPTDTACDDAECAIDHPYILAARQLGAHLVFGNRFEEQVIDQSGGGHLGELQGGAQWVETDGPTDLLVGHLHHQPQLHSYTEIAHHPDLAPTGTHSIAYWRRRHSEVQQDFETDFAKGNDSYQMRSPHDLTTILRYDLRTGAPAGGGEGQGVTYVASPPNTVSFNTWHFVVATFDIDASTMALFVDDMTTPVETTPRDLPVNANDLPLTLGGWDIGTAQTGPDEMGRFSSVDIAGFTLFPTALDADERQLLFDASHQN